jgi:ketosteroid isomerase-like protein
MSPSAQPLEVVQSAYAAFGRGDVPALVALLDDGAEWTFRGSEGLPYTGTFRKDQMSTWFGKVFEADDIQAFEPREFLVGPGHVTVLGWERTKARPSGREFQTEWVHVWVVRGGRIVRFWGMYDTEASSSARR